MGADFRFLKRPNPTIVSHSALSRQLSTRTGSTWATDAAASPVDSYRVSDLQITHAVSPACGS